MKTRIASVFCFCVLFFAGKACAVFSDLDGVFYRQDGSIFYYNVNTAESTNVSNNFGAPITGPWAFSEFGKKLVVCHGGKFYFKDLPSGNWVELKNMKFEGQQETFVAPVNPSDVRNLKLSSYGEMMCYESIISNEYNVVVTVGKINIGMRADAGPGGKYMHIFGNLPTFDPSHLETFGPSPGNGLALSQGQQSEFFSVKRNAFCGCFGPRDEITKEESFAAIYQTPNGNSIIFWEPTDLFFKDNPFVMDKTAKPGIYEITPAPDPRFCQEMAFTPNGSITAKAGEKIFKWDIDAIKKGIEKSRITKRQDGNGKKINQAIPVNNYFVVQPELVADKIKGGRISWINEKSFAYLRNDGAICIYEIAAGAPETVLFKLAPQATPEFFFSREPLFGRPANPTPMSPDKSFMVAPKEQVRASKPEIVKLAAIVPIQFGKTEYFAGLKFSWQAEENGVSLLFSKTESVENIEFAFLDGHSHGTDDIKNPTVCKFQNISGRSVFVPEEKILVLCANGSRYVALKPTKSETYERRLWTPYKAAFR